MADLSNRVPPRTVEEIPEGYERWLADIAARVRSTQFRIARGANAETIRLYWSIGRDILDRRNRQGWGAKAIERLSADLQREFPGRQGFSVSNLNYMRAMVAAWPAADAIPPRIVEELPWGHVRALLDGLDDVGDRDWYAQMAIEQGWSRDVLRFQIQSRLRVRAGAAPSNFAEVLPPQESDLAQQLTKDPYVFEVAALSERLSEHDLDQALMDRLQHTLLELGRGMALAGRQVRLTVDGVDRFIDLLLFHVEQLRYVVIELKVGEFGARCGIPELRRRLVSASQGRVRVGSESEPRRCPNDRSAEPVAYVVAPSQGAFGEDLGKWTGAEHLFVIGQHFGDLLLDGAVNWIEQHCL